MRKIINKTIILQASKRIEQFNESIDNAQKSQDVLFTKIIEKAKNTEWGNKYNYSSIKDYHSYQKNIPVQTYESLSPYIDKTLQGKKDILWPGTCRWFAKSSGTTSNKSKFIPLSVDSLENNHFKAGKDMMYKILTIRPETGIFTGSGLVLGGSHQINKQNGNSLIGDLSAILQQNMPFWAKLWQQPSLKTAFIPDWEEKLNVMAEEVMDKNITHITGVPTWTIVLINKILEIKGTNSLLDVWPNLEVYVHGGVSFSPYKQVFKHLIPDDSMNYFETYNASEGFFAFQDRENASDMLLLTDHDIFYEFIPLEEINNENPTAIPLSEVVVGKNYALVISSSGGLWRYMIGDTIRFTSTEPYRIILTGRTKNFINAFGEEVIIENAEQAVEKACIQCDAELSDFTAAPIYFTNKNNGAHEWIIEFNKPPKDINYFKDVLDKTLKQLNSDYEAKRQKDIALGEPVIVIAPRNTFYLWMKRRGKLGGQNKVPRLFNDRTYVEDIKEFMTQN
jgi:hypothetical protein